jgi:hypothetical protein
VTDKFLLENTALQPVKETAHATTRNEIFVDENPGDKNAYRHGCILIGDEFIFRHAFKVMLDGMIFRQQKIVTHYPTGKGFHRVC